ncbi:unnamed protein product [Cuscuta epithymum]|uniref:Uncharacterized protein n=1 Tax=Cuscuta epithymum TaxID=186058 RepID=A0AAV0CT74_9ASTE|nr:unnamed protein product [Cuscuta epithymum]
MSESFTIQISNDLVKKLSDDGENLKKRSKRPKPKISNDSQTSWSKAHQKPVSEESNKWPLALPPLYLPLPPLDQPLIAELDAIRCAVQESEKLVERLQKKEENMLEEVTQRAKDLHEKEFKLPDNKPIPCLEERDACTKCYRENQENPLKCAIAVQKFAECARRAR